MFLFNFYSNTDEYLVLFLGGVFVAIFMFFLSMSFDSKKFFYLFISSVIVSLMINVNQFPLIVTIFVAGLLIYLSYKFGKGPIKYKIFTNMISVFLFGVLLMSGVFAVRSYLNDGINNLKQPSKVEKKNLRIEVDKKGNVIN